MPWLGWDWREQAELYTYRNFVVLSSWLINESAQALGWLAELEFYLGRRGPLQIVAKVPLDWAELAGQASGGTHTCEQRVGCRGWQS